MVIFTEEILHGKLHFLCSEYSLHTIQNQQGKLYQRFPNKIPQTKSFQKRTKKLTNSGLRKVLLHIPTIDFQVLSSQLSCKKILLDC